MKNFLKSYLPPILICAGIIALVISWGNGEKKRQCETVYGNLRRTAFTVSKCLQGAILVDFRGGVICSVRLGSIMKNIMNESDLKRIALLDKNKVLSDFGTKGPIPETTAADGEELSGNNYFFWHSPPPSVCDSVKKRRGKTDLNFTENQRFLITLDASRANRQIRNSKTRINMIVLLISSVTILLTSLWFYLVRSHKLKNQLSIAHERVERFKEFELAAFGLAHETRHPLGIIRATAQRIVKNGCCTDGRELAEKIIEEADITSSRLGEFMSYAKLKNPEPTQIDAKAFLTSLTELLRPDFEGKEIELNVNVGNHIIEADRDMLQRTTVNLLLNSLAACNSGDKINLNLTKNQQSGCLIVSDTGCGIPEKIKDEIFRPYVTGNKNGHGIGLAIVKKIADEHGWDIKVESEESNGTMFEICGIKIVENG